ncbi:MAG TPA: DUF2934 domain-containing protein [Steroidobacteraceae bacterium]|nr:DUF2934 domain-containing protein [Steroidobacteraceae bacterium]
MRRKTPTGAGKSGARARLPEAQTSETPRSAAKARATVGAEQRRQMVATEAYYIAERRGFAPGHELADWVAAEAAVAAALAAAAKARVRQGRKTDKKGASQSPPRGGPVDPGQL